MEAKQPIPANNRQVKTAKGTEDEEAAEAGVDVRVMDNLIDAKTSDLTGIKNDGAHDGVEDRAVGSRRRKMGHQIEVVDHSPDRASCTHTTFQGPGQRKAPMLLEGALAAKANQGTNTEDPKDKKYNQLLEEMPLRERSFTHSLKEIEMREFRD